MAAAWAQAGGAPATGSASKTLRYALPIAESGFDPAQVTDLYSNTGIGDTFEGPLAYEFLAKPARIRLNTAAAMPEVSADFRTFTVRIKPGIYFADEPAFKGVKRERVAADCVCSLKRHHDPRWKGGKLSLFENAKILGLSELRKELMAAKKPFDDDREVEGVKVLDRYTFQVRLAQPEPRFLQLMVGASNLGALAREVVESCGDRIGEHPGGTGPFRLASWKRGSKMVLERNPNDREVLYEESLPEGDAARQAAAAKFKGRRLPMLDRVEIAILEETQPRWLSFLNGGHDQIEQLPAEFTTVATPNNPLAPHLRKQGIHMERYPRADGAVSCFGKENPVVGGYEPHKVALRRAIAIAVNLEREIQFARRNQAIPGQSPIGPETFGDDPGFNSEMSTHDLPRAKALPDLQGCVDKDGDGWRDQPDATPLVLEAATQPDQTSRQFDELWKKNMQRVGLRVRFFTGKWPEQLKAARAGKLMLWTLGSSAAGSDGQGSRACLDGPQAGSQNLARFKNAEFDKIYDRVQVIDDGPERDELFRQDKLIAVACMPYKITVRRFNEDLIQPWALGYRRPVFWNEWWHMVDVGPSRAPAVKT